MALLCGPYSTVAHQLALGAPWTPSLFRLPNKPDPPPFPSLPFHSFPCPSPPFPSLPFHSFPCPSPPFPSLSHPVSSHPYHKFSTLLSLPFNIPRHPTPTTSSLLFPPFPSSIPCHPNPHSFLSPCHLSSTTPSPFPTYHLLTLTLHLFPH
ncbi:hypothetical protein Pmani_018185 [Petrolisthes manimaculis]|uniref:Uncharacterized protein n=1 Tax=Petrolisthes manimaculis TaxID=1843537 RepID=A0AAE1PNH2_9EUCA|nr:hypothetical protein Pmani_018185 [Petrolisthes manimaculis]